MALFGGRQTPIGLDIGKMSIVGIQMGRRGSSSFLMGFHERPLPEGIMYEGEVVDPVALGDELKAFVRESRMKGKLVNIGVGNQKVIVRQIDVPEMGEEELRGAIEFQAQDYIPIPIEEAVLDFQVVHRYTGNDGIPKQQVLLVAAQKEMVQRFLDAARRAGLKVAGIDVNAFALIRALALPGVFVDQGAGPGDSLCVVNVSSSASTLVVSLNDVPKFTRNISFAYDAFARVLEERQGIPPEDAAVLLERVGLAGPLGPDVETFSDVTIQEVQSSLAPVADSLADEIRRSLDYYQSQDYSASIEHLVLTGRGALMRNLDAYLSESLGLDVELGNPLLKLVENRSGVPDQVLGAIAPRLAVAVGLALEEAE